MKADLKPTSSMDEIEQDPQTGKIIGAAIDLHRVLGHGFLEQVYQEALAIELVERGVPFVREMPIPISYRGRQLACPYKADFVCFNEIIVELKTVLTITAVDQAQVINYLKATGFRRGLLLNFATPRVGIKRFVLDASSSSTYTSVSSVLSVVI